MFSNSVIARINERLMMETVTISMSTLTRMHFQAQENLEQPDPVKDLTIMCNTRLHNVPAEGNNKPNYTGLNGMRNYLLYKTRVIVA